MYVCMYVCTCMYGMCVCVCTCVYVCVRVYMCTYVCMYMYVCMYVCIFNHVSVVISHDSLLFCYICVICYLLLAWISKFWMVLSKHIQAMNDFKQNLNHSGVNYTETRFRTDDGIDGINTEFLVSSQMLLNLTV